MNDDGRKKQMEGKLRDKRIRAIAELMVKADKGKVTEAEFHAEYDRLAKGLNRVEVPLRVMSLYRQMVGDTASTSMVFGAWRASRGIGGNTWCQV
jgi:ABC-type hemin transport system substrate-binding protein